MINEYIHLIWEYNEPIPFMKIVNYIKQHPDHYIYSLNHGGTFTEIIICSSLRVARTIFKHMYPNQNIHNSVRRYEEIYNDQ